MLHAQAEKIMDVPAEQVWTLAGEFGGLKAWLPGVARCEVIGEGAQEDGGNAVRVVEQLDGSQIKEALVAVDANRFSYRYAIVEAKGFDKDAGFEATFTVVPMTADQCKVQWGAQFRLPPGTPPEKSEKARDRVQQMYGFFLQHLADQLSPR